MSLLRVPTHLSLSKALVLSLLLAAPFTPLTGEENQATNTVLVYRSPLPLGALGFELRPLNRPFFVLASAENPVLDQLRITRVSLGGTVVASDGSELRTYPEEVDFRVTASALGDVMLTTQLDPVEYGNDMNSFLLGLRFRLKVYRALKFEVVQPSRIHLIGVPADLPYDERIYRVSFDTRDIPCDARLVLEVLTPSGDRLGRFHLELL